MEISFLEICVSNGRDNIFLWYIFCIAFIKSYTSNPFGIIVEVSMTYSSILLEGLINIDCLFSYFSWISSKTSLYLLYSISLLMSASLGSSWYSSSICTFSLGKSILLFISISCAAMTKYSDITSSCDDSIICIYCKYWSVITDNSSVCRSISFSLIKCNNKSKGPWKSSNITWYSIVSPLRYYNINLYFVFIMLIISYIIRLKGVIKCFHYHQLY